MAFRIQTGWPNKKLSPNGRPNRWDKAKAIRSAKAEGYLATLAEVPPGRFDAGAGRIRLTIIAHPPTAHSRDDDNLVASCKAYRDGIARALDVDDSRFDLQPVQWADPIKGGRLFFEIEAAP